MFKQFKDLLSNNNIHFQLELVIFKIYLQKGKVELNFYFISYKNDIDLNI